MNLVAHQKKDARLTTKITMNDTDKILRNLSDVNVRLCDMKVILSKLSDLESRIDGMENGIGILNSEFKKESRESRQYFFRIIKEIYDEYKYSNASWFTKVKRRLFS